MMDCGRHLVRKARRPDLRGPLGKHGGTGRGPISRCSNGAKARFSQVDMRMRIGMTVSAFANGNAPSADDPSIRVELAALRRATLSVIATGDHAEMAPQRDNVAGIRSRSRRRFRASTLGRYRRKDLRGLMLLQGVPRMTVNLREEVKPGLACSMGGRTSASAECRHCWSGRAVGQAALSIRTDPAPADRPDGRCFDRNLPVVFASFVQTRASGKPAGALF